MGFVRHDDGRVVLEAPSRIEPTAIAHGVLVLLTALGGLAPFPLSFSIFVTGLAAMMFDFRGAEKGPFQSARFKTLVQRLEILPAPSVATAYRGPAPERELRIDGQTVPLRSVRYVGTCEETKSGAKLKRWPVYLVLEEQVVLIRTCTSLAEAEALREELASELDIPTRDLEPHNEWLHAEERDGAFLPGLGLALFYVLATMAYSVASVTSFFSLADALGASVWAGSALATLGIARMLHGALVRGVEADLDPVVERNLKEGVFSDLRVRVEEDAEGPEDDALEEVEEPAASSSLAEHE